MAFKLPDVFTEKGVDLLIKIGGEAGGELFGELAADYILGRRGQNSDPSMKDKFLELIKLKDKEGLKEVIKANQRGIGLGDEQILENDFAALIISGLVDTPEEVYMLQEFFFSNDDDEHVKEHCLKSKERSVYRRAHILETNPHIRRRNLEVMAKMPDHETRRRHVGSSGKLDPGPVDKFVNFFTEESEENRKEIEALDKKIAQQKALFFEGKKTASVGKRKSLLARVKSVFA